MTKTDDERAGELSAEDRARLEGWCENAEYDDANVLLDCFALAQHILAALSLVDSQATEIDRLKRQLAGASLPIPPRKKDTP